MTDTASTPGQDFYARQIKALESRDFDLIVAQYHDDARIVGFDFQVQGADAIRTHFEGYLARLGSIRVLSTDKFTESPDAIFFEATVQVTGGQARVYDVFTLRDGRATRHFTGLLGFTPDAPAATDENAQEVSA